MRRIAIVTDEESRYSREMVRGVLNYARAQPQWRFVFRGRPVLHWDTIDTTTLDADGYICQASNSLRANILTERLKPTGKPIVDVAGTYTRDVPCVMPDFEACGRLAAEHLQTQGFHRFAFAGFVDTRTPNTLYDAFVAHLRPGAVVPTFPPGTPSSAIKAWDRYVSRVRAWVEQLSRPVGILAQSDFRAAHVLMACLEAGLSVPDDVAIIGVTDDVERINLLPIALSSIDVNPVAVGFEAARLLDRLMRRRQTTARNILVVPKGLVVRRSTDILKLDDPLVANACRRLQDAAVGNGIVGALVRELRVSRTLFYRRFARALKTTPQAYLRRLRMNRVRELLAVTDWTVGQIADHCGFPSIHSLSATFKRCEGLSPSAYRDQVRGGGARVAKRT